MVLKNFLILTIIFPLFVYAQNTTYRFSNKPFWKDEFNKDGLPDTLKWSYETGNSGWGNHELEYYTNAKNAIVKNGVLSIYAKKENDDSSHYTSARMITKGNGDFLYGRFEIRAKLPAGIGLWPAIWMMPCKNTYGNWPASGEIDIMEQVGFEPDSIHISTHTKELNWKKGNGITKIVAVKNAESDFHVYSIDWTPKYIRGFVDDQLYFEYRNNNKGSGYYPFNQPFFLILNVAVGGDWGGKKGIDNNIFPAKMDVDYVRVYKLLK